MADIWDRLTNDKTTTIIFIICATILGIALVIGGVCCQKAEYEYHYKVQELIKPR
jgi:hypothetical protein